MKIFSIMEKLRNIHLSKDKLLLILLGGVLLVIISLPVKESTSVSDQTVKNQIESITGGEYVTSHNNTDYAGSLAKEMEELLSIAEGVGETRVLVTLKDSGEILLKSDYTSAASTVTEEDGAGGSRITTEESREETVVYARTSDGSTIPYIINRKTPEVAGVLVIAQGGGNAQIRTEITKAIEAVYGIAANKIKVMEMSGKE